jgi:hypothetical protein
MHMQQQPAIPVYKFQVLELPNPYGLDGDRKKEETEKRLRDFAERLSKESAEGKTAIILTPGNGVLIIGEIVEFCFVEPGDQIARVPPGTRVATPPAGTGLTRHRPR